MKVCTFFSNRLVVATTRSKLEREILANVYHFPGSIGWEFEVQHLYKRSKALWYMVHVKQFLSTVHFSQSSQPPNHDQWNHMWRCLDSACRRSITRQVVNKGAQFTRAINAQGRVFGKCWKKYLSSIVQSDNHTTTEECYSGNSTHVIMHVEKVLDEHVG